jgi:hypothetical protein
VICAIWLETIFARMRRSAFHASKTRTPVQNNRNDPRMVGAMKAGQMLPSLKTRLLSMFLSPIRATFTTWTKIYSKKITIEIAEYKCTGIEQSGAI